MGLARAIGQAIFKSMAPQLAGSAEMIRAARKLGGTYRKTDMLADIRTYTQRAKYQTSISRMSGNKVVPKSWMVETVLKEPGANYRVFGKAKFYDWNTGTEFEKTVSFYHTDLMNKDNFGQDFHDYFARYYKEENLEILSFNQEILEHNEGKPY